MPEQPTGAFPIGIGVEVADNNDIVIQFSTMISNYGIQLPTAIFEQFVDLCSIKLNEAKGNKIRTLTKPDIILPNGVIPGKDQ